MPYINRPYRNRSKYLDYLSRYIDPPEDSPPQTDFVVDLAPFPTSFASDGRAIFPISARKDALRMANRVVKPELVIFATGYTQNFDFLDKESGYCNPADVDMRNVTKAGDESVAFIGFVRPGVGMIRQAAGAIPPLAEMQIFFWISVIKGQIKLPLSAPHYHLLVKETARIKYGVDHSAYMSTLAKDIGASPGLWELWMEYGTQVLVSYWTGMSTSYRKIPPISLSFPQPVTALSFDPISDVLWAGSNTGDVTGYYGTRGIRGVSYKVGGTLAVKKIVAGENHVRALGVSGEGFGTWTKGGMNKWYFRQSRPFPDPLVKIYDLRTMRSLPPIAFSSGPAFIHVLPKRASTIAVISNQGLVNIVDILNPAAASEFYQLDLSSYVTSCAISATAAYMAFGDAEGVIHLLSQAEDTVDVPFNGFDGQPVEWADTPDVLPEIEWTQTT
ncbi:hypothetical protein H0H87_000112 [Tephrocybe sp. NHM501043]|nr:hypothetical protein H0H87_000112 [Tephrocybe sp. NHM501043]